jgi:Spy/CpxP family protein refolding chaperone
MQNNWLRGALGAVLIGTLHYAAVAAPLSFPAQEPASRPPGPNPGRGGNPEQRVAALSKQLKLNDQQKREVTTILQNQHRQLEALRGSAAGDRDHGREGMRQVESNTDAQLKAVLTPAQYSQYQAQKPKPGGPRGDKAGRPPKAAAGAPEAAD